MLPLELKPFVGAGEIKLGMKQSEVRNLLGKEVVSFKRTPSAAFPCDFYKKLGVFIYYKSPGLVEAIEFAAPAVPIFEGANLLGTPFESVKELLQRTDNKLEIENDSLISNHLGIGVFAPDADENPNLPAESVILFEDGYYD